MSAKKQDIEAVIARVNGLFVGQLDESEMEAFNEACNSGLAARVYEGGAGFMGLAKVRVLKRRDIEIDGLGYNNDNPAPMPEPINEGDG